MQVTRVHCPVKASLLAATLALAYSKAGAIGLGEPEVRSWIGSPLRIEIPLHLARGETVDEHCISLQPVVSSGSGDSTPPLPLQLRILDGDHPLLRIESERVAREPFASMRVKVDCGGAALLRDFSVLLDPPPQAASSRTVIDVDAADLPAGSTRPLASAPAPVASADVPRAVPAAGSRRGGQGAAAPRAVSADPGASARLRLETGGLLARRLGAASGSGEGIPVLRLDTHMEVPTAVTPSLVSQRAQLRDLRALMLSGDDTLERLLSLQTQVGSLETQLKSLQGAGAAPGTPAPVLSTPVTATSAAPGAAPAPEGSPAVPAAATSAAATPATAPPTSAPAGPPAAADAGTAPAAAAPPPPPQVKVVAHKSPPPPPAEDLLDWTLPAAAGGASLLLMGGALFLRRRRRLAATAETLLIDADESAVADLPAGLAAKSGARPATAPEKPAADGQSAEQAARSAYLAQRFPEIAAGLIHLHDPDSVVNGARLYMETGERDRAEELLEAAIHDSVSNDVRPWLGLFEVLRQRRDADAYAGLLSRFRERFPSSRYLPEVLAVGHQIDPSRPEFAAVAGGAVPDIGPDGTTWLNPELDFVPQALAQDLHDTLMAELSDEELTLSPLEDRRT